MAVKMQQTAPLDGHFYVGIDVSKLSHCAAFKLATQQQRYEAYPTISIANERSGFEQLASAMQAYAPLTQWRALLECTGHYHAPIQQYLLEQGITVYTVHVQEKPKIKNDKRDAQRLALMVYNQIELGVQPGSSEQEIHPVTAPSEAARCLRTFCEHRYEQIQKTTRIKNQLTAILDELFSEFTKVISDPNGETALNIRRRFPTPAAVATASLDELRECRAWRRPSDADLRRLKELAATSIGVKSPGRVKALVLEQRQLIDELRLHQQQIAEIENEIAEIVEASREGQILLSMGIFGPIQAGAVIASIGTIANFESASKLKGFAGWAPNQHQTGASKDSMKLGKGGNRMLKQTMFLVGMRAIQEDTEWRDLYQRLVPRVCAYDARLGRYKGRTKVLGRVIGQMLTMIYAFFKKDHDLLATIPPDSDPPPPTLYNRETHRMHRRR